MKARRDKGARVRGPFDSPKPGIGKVEGDAVIRMVETLLRAPRTLGHRRRLVGCPRFDRLPGDLIVTRQIAASAIPIGRELPNGAGNDLELGLSVANAELRAARIRRRRRGRKQGRRWRK